MWITTDFSVCTGMTHALPGKCPLLVPARLRNPQHFHRLCTGLALLRTSHPHVCAQAGGKQSCVGWQAAADRRRRRYVYARQCAACMPASAPRTRSRDALVHRRPCQVGTDIRRCRAHVVRRWNPRRGPGCALVGSGMIKVLANRKPLPAADEYRRILCDLPVAAGILVTHTGHTCVITETHPVGIMIRRDRANRRL